MHLTFRLLKKYFPELNKKVIGRERIIQVLSKIGIPVFEVPIEGKGAYVRDRTDGAEYVFIRCNLQGLIRHETLAYESVHAFAHEPAANFLKWRHDLEAEALSLVMMIPETELPRLNKLKHQFDDESYELIKKRNQVKAMWKI